nr:NAD(P)H-binding protein [Streptomyces prunicolor]
MTVFGASGSVGSVLIPEALRRGHEVIAVTRDASHITLSHSNLTVAIAELDCVPTLEKALAGAQAVIISLGDAVCDTGTRAILAAMRNTGVQRVEVLTGFGTSVISRRRLNPAMRGVVGVVRPSPVPASRRRNGRMRWFALPASRTRSSSRPPSPSAPPPAPTGKGITEAGPSSAGSPGPISPTSCSTIWNRSAI